MTKTALPTVVLSKGGVWLAPLMHKIIMEEIYDRKTLDFSFYYYISHEFCSLINASIILSASVLEEQWFIVS